jgi:TP901 family phage tail tape measure protein
MADRTVTVRLRLDSSQWAAGQNAAVRANDRLAASSRAAATRAERDAQRTATAIQGTFTGMARSGEAALGRLDAAAARSAQSVGRSSAAAAASTREVGATATELPATFRAAGAAGTEALGQIDAAAVASTRAVAGVRAGLSATTAAAAAGARDLSLANRLAMAQAAQASRVAAGEVAGTAGAYARAATAAQVMASRVVTGGAGVERSLRGARTASIALVAVFGAAVYASSKFESAMSRVKAATQAPVDELGKLRQAAIKAGSSTQYSATQSADAITELAKAGVSTADILGGALTGTLSLAAAGGMDVADSAVVASKAMNAFGLSGKQMSHIADVIAAAAGKSATDVHGMSLAFAQSSLLAHQTGLSLEQTAGALALFAQNGLVGSDAGTSLKTMLMRLTPQSQEARDLMHELGFSAYDASGNFVGLSEAARRMQKSFSRLTPEARNSAMGVIFGSDAIRAATIVSQAGAEGIDTWTRAANDSGYAARYAATQADNLQGDLRRLKSALETALIQSGTAANGVLRDMAKVLASVVRWYSELPPGVQRSVTILAGMAGVVGLVGASLLLLLPRIAATRTALVDLGVSTATTSRILSTLGRATLVVGVLSALTAGADALTNAMKKPAPKVNELTASLIDLADTGKKTGAASSELDDFGSAVARIAHPSTLNRLDDAASTLGHLGLSSSKVGSYTEAKDKIKALDQALTAMVQNGAADKAAEAFKVYAAEAEKSGTSTAKFKTLLPQYTDALATADTQTKLAAGSQKDLTSASELAAGAIKDTRTEAEKLADVLDALNGASIDAALADIDFRSSLATMTKAIKENGRSLDITREKGRQAKQAILNVAKAADSHAQSVAKQTNSVMAGEAAYARDIEMLKKRLKQQGFTTESINKLTAAYLRLPKTADTKVSAPGSEKTAHELDTIRKKIAAVPPGKSITVRAPSAQAIADLKAIGYKVVTLPDHKVRITVPTKSQKTALADLAARIRALQDRTIVLTVEQRVKSGAMSSQAGKNTIQDSRQASGSVRYYAGGGMERHVAQIARPGEWRVWAEDETGGESYIPLASGKRRRSRAIAEETVRRLGGRGILWQAAGGVHAYAGGGLPTYTPTQAPTLGGAGDPMDRYNAAIQRLKDAWVSLSAAMKNQATQAKQLSAAESRQRQTRADGARRVSQAEANLERVRKGHHTAAQLAAAEDRLTNARAAAEKADKAAASRTAKERADVAAASKTTARARGQVTAADKELGLRGGSRAPTGFDLAAYQRELGKSTAATEAWRRNLSRIGARGGSELRSILEGMGEDGYALVKALAKAGDKQFADITKKLLATAGQAKASLADFESQINSATKTNAQFAADLQKLASEGYGDLAQALASQGDAAAQSLAHQAAGNRGAAAKANASVGANEATLSGDDLVNSITLLATLRARPGQGFAALAGAGLDAATVKALAPKVMKQIRGLPAQYRAEFLQELAGQSGAVAMAAGGILTRPTAVLAGEAGVPEAYIPINGSVRSVGLLTRTAAAMGYQLVPAGRWAGAAQVVGGTTTVHRSQEIHLHAAHQSLGEQRADLLRHMTVLT